MSFSSELKRDLTKYKLKTPAQRLSQLAGLTLTGASLCVNSAGMGALYVTESQAVAKHILSLADGLYQLEPTMELAQQARRKLPLYHVSLTGADAERLLLETGFLTQSPDGLTLGDRIPEALAGDEEEARAFLRGAFLGGGSCVNPRRGYHVEFVLRSDEMAQALCGHIGLQGLCARSFRRKDKYIVYLKGEDVSGLLAMLGGSLGAMELENVRAEKDFRNYMNRKNNCETANIGKTVDAAVAQTHAIEVIEDTVGLNRLPQPLYEAAMLRLNHPAATLQELAEMAEIGKSGINHRLTRLIRMAEEIEHG